MIVNLVVLEVVVTGEHTISGKRRDCVEEVGAVINQILY